jgi:hypothetical protein
MPFDRNFGIGSWWLLSNGMAIGIDSRAKPAGKNLGNFGPEKQNLSRVKHPEQHDNHRARRSIG